jgi:outer membrane protein TolC
VRKLQAERRDLLREALGLGERQFRSGHGTLGEVVEASKRSLAAELDLAATDAERVAAHERHFKTVRSFAEVVRARHAAGRMQLADLHEAQAFTVEAKIGLLKAGGKLKKDEK